MRIVSEDRLGALLGAIPGTPRVVAGGNFATPWRALSALDAAVAEYRLFMLNAQAGVPVRDGVTLETPFAGPGMRGQPARPAKPPQANRSRSPVLDRAPPRAGRS